MNKNSKQVSPVEQWEAIKSLSLNILNTAYCKDWDSVNTRLMERQRLLEEYFRHSLSEEQVDSKMMDEIKAIQHIDDKVMTLVQDNQSKLGTALKKVTLGKKMKAGYLGSSAPR